MRRCAAGSAIEILQEKWVLHIVHALLAGPKGFNELGREVGGCNPTTLAHRLARLEGVGVIHREVLADESANAGLPRCSYELTESGHELEMVIAAIREWAIAHLEPGAD
ncbi:MAG: helix-turn-helix transcriptional regulator [Trueperaceae bacterium]|nr:helix-turn-helix transcriptional regulator [Trueperaceae bacterium]